MRYQVRIISGSLRGRKVTVTADPGLRPMADRVRQALFNILGNAIPDRPFYDVFAGSGAVALEALSRGARSAVFVERDARAANEIGKHLRDFGLSQKSQVIRSDAYRWADKWAFPSEPVNVFLGPPYQEFERHFDAVIWLVAALQARTASGSVLVLQSDQGFDAGRLPDAARWDVRRYGRTQIALWTKPEVPDSAPASV